MERKQVNGKRLGSRIALHVKFPAYYPPLGAAATGIQLPIGQVTHIWGNVLRCYARRGPTREGPLTVPPVKLRPFATNCNDHLVLRIITGGCTNIIRGCGPLLILLSLISYPKLASLHLSQDSSPISRNLYSKRYFPVMGDSSPLSICFPLTVTFHTSPSILSLSSDPVKFFSHLLSVRLQQNKKRRESRVKNAR
jgi:hypothetical protein